MPFDDNIQFSTTDTAPGLSYAQDTKQNVLGQQSHSLTQVDFVTESGETRTAWFVLKGDMGGATSDAFRGHLKTVARCSSVELSTVKDRGSEW